MNHPLQVGDARWVLPRHKSHPVRVHITKVLSHGVFALEDGDVLPYFVAKPEFGRLYRSDQQAREAQAKEQPE
jgi:hypothetical protein